MPEPSSETIEIAGSGHGHPLKGRLRQSAVVGAPQAEAADTLRDRALDALALLVRASALLALALLARRRRCLALGVWMQGQPTACRSGTLLKEFDSITPLA